MSIHEFVISNNIRPADAIMLQKKFFGMLDHYVIYLGIRKNDHHFVANYTEGVKVIPNAELSVFLEKLVPKSIEKFNGSEEERKQAVSRAVSRVGEKAYSYITNNCEHFKNWVQKGVNDSPQVKGFIKGSVISGVTVSAIALAANNKKVAAWGLGLATVGLIVLAIAENNKKQ